jgi:hypothetical protein
MVGQRADYIFDNLFFPKFVWLDPLQTGFDLVCQLPNGYSEPNLKAIKALLYKRGYAKINGQRIPINDNSVIEKALGKHGLVCIEDLVHELATCGPNFKAATTFLYPFKLSNPNGMSLSP